MRTIIAFVTLIIATAKLSLSLLIALHRQQSVTIQTQSVVGKGMRPINLRIFKVKGKPLVNIDLWFHYLKGDFDLVGPKPLSLQEAQRLEGQEFTRFNVAPGLITPYNVKIKAGIAHSNESKLACEFAENASLMRRTQILFAALFQTLIGNGTEGLHEPDSINLFDVEVDNVTMDAAIESIMHRVQHRHTTNTASQFSFVNADCVNKYVHDGSYRNVLNACERVFADGIGIRIAARWHGKQLKDNVNGTDLFPLLCQELSKKKKKLFLYGGKKKVVKKVVERIKQEYPDLIIAGHMDGYTHSSSDAVEQINKSGADIVLVALGAPLQEEWIANNKHALLTNVAIGVGGLFDFYSGSVSRAPEWVRELSMEWVWRLMAQPKDKAKRYLLGNPLFLGRLLWSKSSVNHDKNSLEIV